MPTWKELEARFEKLEEALRWGRLDRQSGTEGEYWRLVGAADTASESRFESLSKMAGRKLLEPTTLAALPYDVLSAPSDEWRWYRGLARQSRFYRPGHMAYPLNDEGKPVGWIGTGTVEAPASASAAYCLHLASETAEEDEAGGGITFNVSGSNARVNYRSIDNSSTILVFKEAREFIANNITDGWLQEALLEKLTAIEQAEDNPTKIARYREFVSTAADHVTLLAPILGPLAGTLS